MYAKPNPQKVAWQEAQRRRQEEEERCYRQWKPAQIFNEAQMTKER